MPDKNPLRPYKIIAGSILLDGGKVARDGEIVQLSDEDVERHSHRVQLQLVTDAPPTMQGD